MTPDQLLIVFKKLEDYIRVGTITPTEVEIWKAENSSPFEERKDPEEMIKTILRKFFTLYGINPSVQFSDPEFKQSYIQELRNLLKRYFPNISPEALQLAIELNMINYFKLPKTVPVFGDRVTADFFVQVLQIYRSHKGVAVSKVDKLLPKEPEPVPDRNILDKELREMLLEDRNRYLDTSEIKIRMPREYYFMLVRQKIVPEDYYIEFMQEAHAMRKSHLNQARIRGNSPETLKELDMIRAFQNATSQNATFQVQNIAMEIAIISLIKKGTV